MKNEEKRVELKSNHEVVNRVEAVVQYTGFAQVEEIYVVKRYSIKGDKDTYHIEFRYDLIKPLASYSIKESDFKKLVMLTTMQGIKSKLEEKGIKIE